MSLLSLRRAAVLFALAPVALVAIACGGSKDNGAPLAAALKDYSITLDQSSVAAGKITFTVNNSGPSTHELAIFKTDLPAAKLPVVDNLVPEEAPGYDLVDEVESVKSGKTKKLTVDLKPGHYALICNILAHYEKGMHVDLTVK